MPKPRVLEKYDVDESRCILCGICVDACPYDALRCGPDFELVARQPRRCPSSTCWRSARSTATRRSATSAASATGSSAPTAKGRIARHGRMLPVLPRETSPATATRTANGNGHAAHGGNGQHAH